MRIWQRVLLCVLFITSHRMCVMFNTLYKCKSTRVQNYIGTRVQDYKSTRKQKYKNTKVQEHKSTRDKSSRTQENKDHQRIMVDPMFMIVQSSRSFSPTQPHWAELVIESPCPFVCLSVCAIAKHPLPEVV